MPLRVSLWEGQRALILRLVCVGSGFSERTSNPWNEGKGHNSVRVPYCSKHHTRTGVETPAAQCLRLFPSPSPKPFKKLSKQLKLLIWAAGVYQLSLSQHFINLRI